jgi:capsular polysaccharide biosynthesis protein
MLNLNQARELRQLIENRQPVAEKDGMVLNTVEVAVPSEASTPLIDQQSEGSFYKPREIFGVPTDPSCLNGIATLKLPLARRQVRRIEQGRIIGTCAVLTADGFLHSADPVTRQSLDWSLGRNKTNHEGYVLHCDGDVVKAIFVGRSSPKRIQSNALYLHNIEPGNYGSFLIRQLQQMVLMKPFAEYCDAYVTPSVTPWFVEALGILEYPRRPIFASSWICGDIFDSVTFANDFDSEGFLSSDLRNSLLERLLVADQADRSRKLYVSRALSTIARPLYRPVLNEDVIENEVLSRGFEIVYPETLSLQEQARVFSQAACVIGPSGSGMLNCMFSKEGTRVVDMESMHMTVRQHAKVYSSSNLEYSFLFGQIEQDDRPMFVRKWHVPLSLLDRALSWLKEASPTQDLEFARASVAT